MNLATSRKTLFRIVAVTACAAAQAASAPVTTIESSFDVEPNVDQTNQSTNGWIVTLTQTVTAPGGNPVTQTLVQDCAFYQGPPTFGVGDMIIDKFSCGASKPLVAGSLANTKKYPYYYGPICNVKVSLSGTVGTTIKNTGALSEECKGTEASGVKYDLKTTIPLGSKNGYAGFGLILDPYNFQPGKISSFSVFMEGGDGVEKIPKSYLGSQSADFYSVTSTPAEADAIAASRPAINMMNLRAKTNGYGPAAYKPVGP